MRKDTDLISQATKDSSGKITFEFREEYSKLECKPYWNSENWLCLVDLYDERLGKRQWPTVSKSDLVSSYNFEPNEKENLDEEQLLEIIKQRIERTIQETKIPLFSQNFQQKF